MTKFPLKLRVFRAKFVEPFDASKSTEFIVSGRRADIQDDFKSEFVIRDPKTDEIQEAYGSVERAMEENTSPYFYWVDKILTE